ncbi:MAG: hypothetical protein ACT4NU_06650 [Chromatiales bacterium]
MRNAKRVVFGNVVKASALSLALITTAQGADIGFRPWAVPVTPQFTQTGPYVAYEGVGDIGFRPWAAPVTPQFTETEPYIAYEGVGDIGFRPWAASATPAVVVEVAAQ